MSLLSVKNLSISFETLRGHIQPVDGISLHIDPGETLGLVGESGSGKSLTSLAIMDLLPKNARIQTHQLNFAGQDLNQLTLRARRKFRGGRISMIFQDPMTSLNPSFTVGFQLMEVLKLHRNLGRAERKKEAIHLLEKVGIKQPEARLSVFPHQLSGGMCQRVMIAIAIASQPKLLIADEPTTALDVTIQAQILDLLRKLQKETGMALLLITHDLAVVSEMADRTAVMYAGQIVEVGNTEDIVRTPRHPYTEGLLQCLPASHENDTHKSALPTIPGIVPDLVKRPTGCQLHPRCSYATQECSAQVPTSRWAAERFIKCHFPLEKEGAHATTRS